MTTPRTDERDALVIETSGGAVRGVTDGRVVSWKGIPYAAPPVGSLRFAPPEPHPGWSGVFDAAEFGPASPQLPGPMSVGRPNDVVESEDCLNLNVWAPATPAEKSRAVMVWVHGGANFGGSSSEWFYDGTNLADRQDIVVVSINYRLGMLGGLSLDNDATMGNNDLLDVILAMRWVQDNIANFGGDPHRVTIAGESAGACMISDLLVSDRAEGLFEQAIISSGHGQANSDRAFAHLTRDLHLAALGETLDDGTLDRLRQQPVDALLAAQGRTIVAVKTPYKTVEDGHIVPITVMEAFAAGKQHRVPILVGTTRDEHNLFAVLGSGHNVPPAEVPLRERFRNILVDADEAVLDELEQRYLDLVDNDETAAWNVACTDRDWRAPQRTMALHHADSGAPVYAYDWAFPSTQVGGALGACHALDLPFWFDNLHQPGVDQLVGSASDNPQRDLVAAMSSDAWGSFVRDGRPSSEHLPDWPRYDRSGRATMVIAAEPHVGPGLHDGRLDAWDEIEAIPPLWTPYEPAAD
ncbi:MAG: carboxylesterase family protein [Acidimicrobiales bacterium]